MIFRELSRGYSIVSIADDSRLRTVAGVATMMLRNFTVTRRLPEGFLKFQNYLPGFSEEHSIIVYRIIK